MTTSKTETAPHYRWQDMPQDHPMPLVDRRRIIGERMMLSEVILHKGCTVPSHHHENEQIAYVTRGSVRFGIGDEQSPEHYEVVVSGGQVLHLLPNVPHSAHALEESRVIDIFSPVSQTTGVDGG